jgi:hypothetical protein
MKQWFHFIYGILICAVLTFEPCPSAYAGDQTLDPDSLPFRSWGELKEGAGGEHEGRVLELYGEQGASWKIGGTNFEFVPFLAAQLKHSDESEQSWNNYWKAFVGIKFQSNFFSSTTGKAWYEGQYGLQIDTNVKNFTSGNPENSSISEVEVKLFYYVQGDWLKR